jgi:hypothetical protein
VVGDGWSKKPTKNQPKTQPTKTKTNFLLVGCRPQIKATLQGAEAANVAASSSEEDHGWAEMPLTVTIINLFIA